MTDNEIIKAWDILAKFDFFGGQRAGRELWFEKPVDIQDEDIRNFSNDVAFLKDFINRQKAENERLETNNLSMQKTLSKMSLGVEQARSEALKEFWQKLKEKSFYDFFGEGCEGYLIRVEDGENIVKEMIGEQE